VKTGIVPFVADDDDDDGEDDVESVGEVTAAIMICPF